MKKKTLKNVPHINLKNLKGFVFIGDPHIWSFKPGRRLDDNYLKTILGKMKWIANYCNENKLIPIILGDLLDDAQDNDLSMLSDLVDTLQDFETKPIVLVGNHDINEKKLKPGTVLYLLHQTGQIDAMIDNGPFRSVTLENNGIETNVLIGGTPYGEDVPISITKWVGNATKLEHQELKDVIGMDKVIWITHDDFAFDSSYPNAIALKPIEGVDIAVNGHMHRTQKPVLKGQTAWYNPGNINRLTIDLIDQTPKIWVYIPNEEKTQLSSEGLEIPLIESVEIPHIEGKLILSQEGRISTIEQKYLEKNLKEDILQNTLLSKFVEQIKDDDNISRSDDGVYLASVINEEYEILNVPPKIQNIVSNLFEKALLQHRGKIK